MVTKDFGVPVVPVHDGNYVHLDEVWDRMHTPIYEARNRDVNRTLEFCFKSFNEDLGLWLGSDDEGHWIFDEKGLTEAAQALDFYLGEAD